LYTMLHTNPIKMKNTRSKLIYTILRHEIRMLLRDRRTIIFSILLPLVVMPFFLFIQYNIQDKQKQKLEVTTYRYAVAGSQADLIRAVIDETLKTITEDKKETGQKFRCEELTTDDPEKDVENKTLHFYLEGLSREEIRVSDKINSETQDQHQNNIGNDLGSLSIPSIRIYYYANRDSSRTGAGKMKQLLADARSDRQETLLKIKGFPLGVEDLATVETSDVATGSEISGSMLGKYLTTLVLLFILTSGSIIATDSIAGEKERGTLETLLTTAAGRSEIITAKQLSILLVAIVITIIQVLNILVYIGFGFIPLPENFTIDVTAGKALLVFIVFLPMALLVSSILLMVSGRAKTYKEAQLYFTPVFLLLLALSSAAALPGIQLRSFIAIIPVCNTSVAIHELLVDKYDWIFLTLSLVVNFATALWTSRITLRFLSTERLITASDSSDLINAPADRFQQKVLLWFALIWVIIFVVAVRMDESTSLKSQVLLNVVILFGGGSFLIIRKYGLNLKETLALRAPKPWVWLAVMIGIPAGLTSSIGLFHLANLIFPVPEQFLKQMENAIMPEELPLWQLLIFISILPGIFEEIAFRGVLLHGLKNRFRPFVLCLVVGIIFGFFHVTLYRIIPTAYLGILLTAVTLLTGSIFPAMVWHMGNNAMGVLINHINIPLEDLEPAVYICSFVILGLVFWIIYRSRTPYPDLENPSGKLL